MDMYAFQLGRKEGLCLAELCAVLGKDKLIEHNNKIAIFHINNKDDEYFQDLQNKLGGTIKIMKILEKNVDEESIKNEIESILKQHFKDHEGKARFALSTYNNKKLQIRYTKKILNFSKKFLKSLKINSRFVNKDLQKNPKPSTIYKARVLKKGIDLNLIQGKDRVLLGKTITIQDIDSYSKRDYNKPKRDARIGMLPPKLSQIMINLACLSDKQAENDTKTILDPFCGTGGILMEGLLMGRTMIGSDIDKRMVEYSKKNCEWLIKEFRTTSVSNNFRTFVRDASFLNKDLIPEKIDAIITESYLGPPQTSIPSTEEQEKIFRELENLHYNWLKAASEVLESGGKIVMCLPNFKIKGKFVSLPNFKKITKERGFEITDSFIYDRPDQIVARQIVVLEKFC